MKHECDYEQFNNLVFVCSICKDKHICGEGCDRLFYNENYTRVCEVTGLCFNQKVCDAYVDTKKGVLNTIDTLYYDKTKKTQQTKNKNFEMNLIHSLLTDVEDCTNFKIENRVEVITSLKRLWVEFINIAIEKDVYIHRKDARCFIVAVLFSLGTGIETSSGVIVHRNKSFDLKRINKKKAYKNFRISDIRYGQRLIMRVFSDKAPAYPFILI